MHGHRLVRGLNIESWSLDLVADRHSNMELLYYLLNGLIGGALVILCTFHGVDYKKFNFALLLV
jgi:hypothetical protein